MLDSVRTRSKRTSCNCRHGNLRGQLMKCNEREQLSHKEQHMSMLDVILLKQFVREHEGGPKTQPCDKCRIDSSKIKSASQDGCGDG